MEYLLIIKYVFASILIKLSDKKGKILRKKILDSLIEQGFKYNPHLRPKMNTKQGLRIIHKSRRLEMIRHHSKFLTEFMKTVKDYTLDGYEIDPREIKLELRYVESESFEAKMFLWWNLVWWKIPYEHPVGRQMRFIIWDKTHDLPFGLIGLQSPILKMAVRDTHLKIPNNKLDYWLNMSLHGQRVGALPPYNELLGGKLAALTLTSNEIREVYSKKYRNKKTVLRNRKIPAHLLFTTTTGAFGKSSIYDRLKYFNKEVGEFLGFTAGSGTFFVNDTLYSEILDYLSSIGYDTRRGINIGSSRKLKFIDTALSKLGMQRSSRDGIRRGFYLFSNVDNLKEIISHNSKPKWFDRSFDSIQDFWLKRYCIPRAERREDFREFNPKKLFIELHNDLKLKQS